MENKTIVLVGQPNAGKSTLYNVLSDKKTSTSNFAGTTVKVKESLININGETFRIVDLPGTYSLNPTDAAEQITYNYLLNNNIDLIINVLDASMAARSLVLSLELAELDIPMVIALNMQDEAHRQGININAEKLEKILNIPVVPVTALFGKGVRELAERSYDTIFSSKYKPETVGYAGNIETHLEDLEARIESLLEGEKSRSRHLAVKSIENPGLLPDSLLSGLELELDDIGRILSGTYSKDNFEIISSERYKKAKDIAEQITTLISNESETITDKLDRYLLHPVLGYAVMSLFFAVYFFAIFIIGDLLSKLVSIPLDAVSVYVDMLKSRNEFLWFTVNGAYQGIVGAVGIVLPYFLPLVFITSLFEDTGYLARLAFLIDNFMHKIGLHGKSVVAFILGFACSVPAIYATRIMENRRERMITGMLIPFIPCSARISVIFAIAAAVTGPFWAAVVFFFVMLIIGINGRLLSRFLKNPVGLILEIPVLKAPSLRITFQKTWLKIRDFIEHALLFLIVGSIVLGWFEYFHAAHYVNILFAPIVKNILGLPEQLGSTLVFGFFRKELIIVMTSQALGVDSLAHLPMSISQIVVFMIFVTLYFPCFTTFVVILKEFGTRVAVGTAVLSVSVATISAYLFKLLLG